MFIIEKEENKKGENDDIKRWEDKKVREGEYKCRVYKWKRELI